MEESYDLSRVNPFVRDVGFQGLDSWRLLQRRIYDHELMYCLSGMATLSIHGSTYSLTRGDLAVITPDTPHTFWTDEEHSGEIIWVHFDMEPMADSDWLFTLYNTPERYAKLFSTRLQHPEHIRPQAVIGKNFRLPDLIHIDNVDEAERIFRSLYKAYMRKDPMFSLTSRIQMLSLLALVYVQFSGTSTTIGDENTRIIDKVKRYLNINYARKLSMEAVAASVHLSPDYCGRLFRKLTGQTVMEYLTELRVNRAKHLLLDEDLTISQVAELTGMKRASYFNMVIKKHTGMTPLQLRRFILSIIDDNN